MRVAILIALCGSFLVNATPTPLAAPSYLSIPNVDKCLAEQSHGDYTTRCLPKDKPKDCCDESWGKLNALKEGERVPTCKPPTPVLPPKYLDVKDWKKCTCENTRGSAKFACLPKDKPKDCCDESWKALNALTGRDKPEACVSPAPPPPVITPVLPPKYLDVKDWKKCTCENTKGSAKFACLPKDKPKDCCDESWKALNALTGRDKPEACVSPAPPPPVITPVLPPKYLDVKDWKKCTCENTRGSAKFACLPKDKPKDCCDESWKALNALTGRDKPEACVSPAPPPVTTTALPPKYLDVKDWKKCTCENTRGSAKFACLPKDKPKDCCDESWKALNALTGRDKPEACVSPAPPVVTTTALPPKYLDVKDWKKCTCENTRGSAKFVCLPKDKPKDCCDESWGKLNALTGRDRPEACVSPAPPPVTTTALPPKYLGVKDWKDCLTSHKTGTSESWCLPCTKPAKCCDKSWGELNAFTGGNKVPACPK